MRHPLDCGLPPGRSVQLHDDGLLAATLDALAAVGVVPTQPVVHLTVVC